MLKFVLAAATIGFFALPLPASASEAPSSDVSAQVRVGPDGVTIGRDHRRYESRRRERRRGRDCRTRRVTEWVNGRRVTRTTRVCD